MGWVKIADAHVSKSFLDLGGTEIISNLCYFWSASSDVGTISTSKLSNFQQVGSAVLFSVKCLLY